METIIVAKILFTCPNIKKYPPQNYNDKDKQIYEYSKSIRGTEEGQKAIEDADWSVEYLLNIFGEVLKIKITKETTPILYTLLTTIYTKHQECHYEMSKIFFKERPYVYMKEQSTVKKDEKILKNVSSYPSGQSQLGWIFGQILSKVSPKDEIELLHRGWEYGQGRVITGYHWQSDVDLSREIANIFLYNLYQQDTFKQIIEKAKVEVIKQKEMYSVKVGFKTKF